MELFQHAILAAIDILIILSGLKLARSMWVFFTFTRRPLNTRYVTIGVKLYKDEHGYLVVDNNTACNGKLLAIETHTFHIQ